MKPGWWSFPPPLPGMRAMAAAESTAGAASAAGPPALQPAAASGRPRPAAARFAPAAVLATAQGDIVYISGKTGKYLEPAAGKVNNNVFAMAREGLAWRAERRLLPRPCASRRW
jgi:two-component system CheB/CheR fusion protein